MKKRRILVIGLIMLCCLCFTLLQTGKTFAQTAHATHVASGHSYDGQWPDVAGCWGYSAYTIAATDATMDGHPTRIYLWYSPACGTNWSDYQILDGYSGAPISTQVCKASGQDGPYLCKSSSTLALSRIWSPMVYAPHDPAIGWGVYHGLNGFTWSFNTGWIY